MHEQTIVAPLLEDNKQEQDSEKHIRDDAHAPAPAQAEPPRGSVSAQPLPERFRILPHVEDRVNHDAPAFHDIKQAIATLRPEEPAAHSLRALHLRTGFGMLHNQAECGVQRSP